MRGRDSQMIRTRVQDTYLALVDGKPVLVDPLTGIQYQPTDSLPREVAGPQNEGWSAELYVTDKFIAGRYDADDEQYRLAGLFMANNQAKIRAAFGGGK
jgi:hypothetical protein